MMVIFAAMVYYPLELRGLRAHPPQAPRRSLGALYSTHPPGGGTGRSDG